MHTFWGKCWTKCERRKANLYNANAKNHQVLSSRLWFTSNAVHKHTKWNIVAKSYSANCEHHVETIKYVKFLQWNDEAMKGVCCALAQVDLISTKYEMCCHKGTIQHAICFTHFFFTNEQLGEKKNRILQHLLYLSHFIFLSKKQPFTRRWCGNPFWSLCTQFCTWVYSTRDDEVNFCVLYRYYAYCRSGKGAIKSKLMTFYMSNKRKHFTQFRTQLKLISSQHKSLTVNGIPHDKNRNQT